MYALCLIKEGKIIMKWCAPKKKALTIMEILCFFNSLFIFREEGKGGSERERNISVWFVSCMPLTGDLAYNPGMCPDWESNW